MAPSWQSRLYLAWWRHQLETFSALLAICAENSPLPGEFPAQRPVTRSFDVFFDPRLNKRLSKQSWGWWFETPSRPLWRHRNVNKIFHVNPIKYGKQAYANGRKSSIFIRLLVMPPSWQWTWWRHQVETFSVLLTICAGNSPVPGEFPAQRPVTWNFDVSFDLRLNKRLSKQS